ncbi:hypothetical protein SE92_16570 [Bradyrhizobium sp. AT1]|uniref:hypothetical protein n=1 Tax=Bradyrhizobium sp. AT1 TaxID=574934 RepID=UPI0007977791|nr:hypothetical protein [Bradyrhizobium sp. AT1]KYG21669.1 hypothetical protein SE92_16570 [Bradyrhizobium sp. AT1]
MVLKVVQIVPSLVPGRDGLGDYASKLAMALNDKGIETTFIVANHLQESGWTSEPSKAGHETACRVQLQNDTASSLVRALSVADAQYVLIHMAAYGYDEKGIPVWLVDGLEDYQRRTKTKIVSIFHELWQEPVLWKKTVIRWYFQYREIRRLFDISDGFVTNTQRRFEQVLKPWNSAKPGFWMPVISNVGELNEFPCKEGGLGVVFGLSSGKSRIYEALRSRPSILSTLRISKLVEIGSSSSDVPGPLRAITTLAGQLKDEAVSDFLTRAQYGFIHYDSGVLEKSGVFNAYAAHGVCAVNLGKSKSGASTLVCGRNYLSSLQLNDAEFLAAFDPNEIGRSAFNWYKGHNLSAMADSLVKLIRAIA